MNYKIKLMNKIADAGVEQLDKSFVVSNQDPDGIIVRSADMTDYVFNPELCAIARAGVGYNNIPIDRCSEDGIVVFNTPGANANAVRELVLCALLISSRRIIDAVEWCKTLAGDPEAEVKAEKGKSQFVGPELAGKTLGIIGLGHVGVIVANAAVDLGMNVLGYDPYLSLENAWGMARRVQRAASYDEIYENADYITIHAPLNDETRNMISAGTIAKMKYGVRIINLARGGLVNNDDIKAALASGKVGRYVTDFPSAEILGFENVIALPHLGASTPESEENCAVMAARQISDYLLTGNIVNSVNYPNIVQPLTTAHRITVLHRNIPNMISYATGIIGAQGINIEHLYTTARGTYAYMMIDTNTQPDAEAIEKLKQNDGILRVRVL